ncbi:MAG: HipA domain-containing protein [Azospirillaceae bacterium]
MLYLVGETLDKDRAYYQAETGKIVKLMRGVYVDADDDIEAGVLRYAVRIARYLYPRAYLSGASASRLGPTRDARLFLSGPRAQRTRIRTLEIAQTAAPPHADTVPAVVDDGMGEFTIRISSPRQRLLESFRQRSEIAAAMSDDDRADLARRLIDEHGGPRSAADSVWVLARQNGWHREAERAERYLQHAQPDHETPNAATIRLTVAWHGQPLGTLVHDGVDWRWDADPDTALPVVQQRLPGRLPPFIQSLLPEGWLESVLGKRDERALLRTGKRYMSNITITEATTDPTAIEPDVLVARLVDHSREGLFTGTYDGPGRSTIESDFEAGLAEFYARASTPRLSGVQIKAPMHLDRNGTLSIASRLPFTHILKPAGTGAFQALPVIEYLAMTLGRRVGLATPDVALVQMPDGMAPALLVERFDIRTSPDDRRHIALEDMCSVLGLSPDAKYDGTIERVAHALRPVSTEPDEDLRILLQRALFAWLIGDGDMHLKNLALLKIAGPERKRFDSVRLAPLYDAVTTRVFPGLESDRMALKLNGKDDRLRRADFRRAAATMSLGPRNMELAIDEFLGSLARALGAVSLPDGLSVSADLTARADKAIELCRGRIDGFDSFG